MAGLPRELGWLGRFGLFGESLGGGGPDGTVLRLLVLEEREGEHLGVPFRGTVAFCEGTDVPSRPARSGARITGAALHEGYWIDVEGVRDELRRWRDLERRFFDGADTSRARRALEALGPEARSGGDAAGAGTLARAGVHGTLGEADRVRLAVLLERDGVGGERIELEELLEATARHEEGHLTDRTRFLPILKHPLRALGLAAARGFSPRGIALELEYRAQLVALCTTEDPRVPLAECLDGAEGGIGVTAHAEAYRELVTALLEVLDAELESFENLDPDRTLVHQLHRLSAEDVRRLSLLLADRKGMVEE